MTFSRIPLQALWVDRSHGVPLLETKTLEAFLGPGRPASISGSLCSGHMAIETETHSQEGVSTWLQGASREGQCHGVWNQPKESSIVTAGFCSNRQKCKKWVMCALKPQISLSWSEEEVGTLAKSVTSSCTSRRYPLSLQRGVWGDWYPSSVQGYRGARLRSC